MMWRFNSLFRLGCLSRRKMSTKQSPINILSSETKKNSSILTPLVLSSSWGCPTEGVIENTGYYLKFTGREQCSLITYNGEYVLDHFHYHWGSCNGEGAEHYIDGKAHDIEFHFVHKQVSDAQVSPLTVLAVFGVADLQASISGVWEALSPFNVLAYGSKHSVSEVVPSHLLPTNKDYYHYHGSLTTPKYDEIVQWIVLKEPILVPNEYLKALRLMNSDKQGCLIEKNYRALQDLSSRTVHSYDK